MNDYYYRSVTQVEIDRWDKAILGALKAGDDPEHVAECFNTSVEYVQRICGDAGHVWIRLIERDAREWYSLRACIHCDIEERPDYGP